VTYIIGKVTEKPKSDVIGMKQKYEHFIWCNFHI